MGKSIYHLLNDVQVALDDYDQEALSPIEKKRILGLFIRPREIHSNTNRSIEQQLRR
jgi:hypothetical protein